MPAVRKFVSQKLSRAVDKVTKEIVVSFSRIRSWRRCHRMHHYKYHQFLKKVKPAVALIRGTIVHEMLDTLAAKGKLSDVVKKYQASHGKVFAEERELYGDMLFECLEVIQGYRDHWEGDELEDMEFDGRRAEFAISVPLIPGVQLNGKIDSLKQDTRKRVWYTDHKTAKTIPDEEARYSDYQLLTYGWVGPQVGLPKPDGVIWDYLRTKIPVVPETLKKGGLTKRMNIDTTYEVYLAEVNRLGLKVSDYEEILENLRDKTEKFYRRIQLPFSNKAMVETVVSELKFVSKDILERGENTTDRSMDRSCKWCEYRMLCAAELRGLDADFIREHEYKVDEKMEWENASEEDNDG